MRWQTAVKLQFSAILILVSFQIHISSADVEAQNDKSTVKPTIFTVEDYKTVQENATEPTPPEKGMSKRSAIHEMFRWPDAVLPYTFESAISSLLRKRILKATKFWEKHTCIQFRPKNLKDEYWITFRTGGCGAVAGRAYPGQFVNLGYLCDAMSYIIHELGHSIGLQHQHNRPDRDLYIRVYKGRIVPEYRSQFKKLKYSEANTFNLPYDYYSIMHYNGDHAYAIGNQVVIETINKKYQNIIGNMENPSYYDYKIVNLMYKCGAKCSSKRCPEDGFRGKYCVCYCKRSIPTSPVRRCSEKNCQDKTHNCKTLARKGGCKRNRYYMNKYCKLTCKKCPGHRQ